MPFYTFDKIGIYNDRSFDKNWEIQGPPLVAGVSVPTKSITVPLFRYAAIEMQKRAKGNQNGYEAIYSASSTVPGMSGGPVVGARACAQRNPEYYKSNEYGFGWSSSGAYPGVIGMHGMSEEYSNSGARSGTSLGIPLDLIVDFLGKNADSYGVLVGRGYYDEVLKMCKQELIR